MEGELRELVNPPIIHPALQSRFCDAAFMTKKRDFPWKSINYHPQHQLFQLQQNQILLSSGLLQNSESHWNRGAWGWDNFNFIAKPNETVPGNIRPGTAELEHKKKAEAASMPPASSKSSPVYEDGEGLTLKLGGGSVLSEEPVVRPNKRVRSGPPGGGSNHPICQVDDCGGDLSNAKDYHRRHKVCELHSKISKALVGQQVQRFCQQCSRFHPLSEFDEGKRSCRRRLAGHNRRRRKNQPDDASSRPLIPPITESNSGGNIDIINLLTILAHFQDKTPNGLLNPDKDRLIQILSKLNSLSEPDKSSTSLQMSGSFDLNVSQSPQAPLEHLCEVNGISHAPMTKDLLAVLSAPMAGAKSTRDALPILSQCINDNIEADKVEVNCFEQEAGLYVQKKQMYTFPSAVIEKNSGVYSQDEVSDCLVQELQHDLPLQLFHNSPDDGNPPKLGNTRKCISSDSSNPIEERSSSSSPLVEQKLFPLHSSAVTEKHLRMSTCREDYVATESNATCRMNPGFELFSGSYGRAENGASISNLPYPLGDSSSSSDQSPTSSNSGSQDRTGRIIFKLFGKDPSDFPGSLRNEIFNWLSHSPSEMESYIRPGCVVLSIYASMPSIAWEELQENLLQHVNSLVQDSDSNFWRNGRFLIHTNRRLALHKDGKIRLLKLWRTWNSPELISVSPIAFVADKDTSFILRGRNLTVPGTKVHCTYMGGYISAEASGSLQFGTVYDDLSIENFCFPGGSSIRLGRCFIEVENGFKGNSFPLIVADANVCQELRVLESELEEDARKLYSASEAQTVSFGRSRARAEILHFLNELGWLFQRRGTSSGLARTGFPSDRIKLLLTFSVERDWTAVLKTLLDLIFEDKPGLGCSSKESMQTLEEIHILNRAVKRKCRNMVNMLLNYTVNSSDENEKTYLFFPNQAGPGGLTPLHLAACTQDSEDIVNELTNDPQSIGLNCWNSILDSNGMSPHAYASTRSHHSYNQMVIRKLIDRRNNQVSLAVGCPEISSNQSQVVVGESERTTVASIGGRSCAQCATVAPRRVKRLRCAHGLHRPHIHLMLAIAAVCVCVCVFFRVVRTENIDSFITWETISFGSS